MDENKKKSDAPIGAIIIVGILLLFFGIYIVSQLIYGTALFVSDGGWIWLLVIIGVAIFAYYLVKNSKTR